MEVGRGGLALVLLSIFPLDPQLSWIRKATPSPPLVSGGQDLPITAPRNEWELGGGTPPPTGQRLWTAGFRAPGVAQCEQTAPTRESSVT